VTLPFSLAIIVANTLFFFIGFVACTTFTSLLHAKELALNIFTIGILVATNDKIRLFNESYCVNFKEEE
jgi:hypothetical protein